jgi:CheY-like chemotaxis protein
VKNLECRILQQTSRRCRVLLVEDEVFIAVLLEEVLAEAGYEVVGPAPHLEAAMQAAADEMLDAAVLDMNLRDRMVFPVATRLRQRGIPFMFCSGYVAADAIPAEFSDIPRLFKPYRPAELLDVLAAMVGQG